MRQIVAIIAAIALFACAGAPPAVSPPAPEAPPCETSVFLRRETINLPANKGILEFAWIDEDCDRECDRVLIWRYLGHFAGSACFEYLGEIPCDRAESVLSDLREEARKFGVSI